MIPAGFVFWLFTSFAEFTHAADRTVLLFVFMIGGFMMVGGAIQALYLMVLRFWPAPWPHLRRQFRHAVEIKLYPTLDQVVCIDLGRPLTVFNLSLDRHGLMDKIAGIR